MIAESETKSQHGIWKKIKTIYLFTYLCECICLWIRQSNQTNDIIEWKDDKNDIDASKIEMVKEIWFCI